ncbi:MAG TPA: PhoH family protein [Phycisphaerales bacterium]|nr:PhoH family protein [Phycisphaerales bacterium]HMP36179.1 PhoH family protein [Phycisphaerales bacterium]
MTSSAGISRAKGARGATGGDVAVPPGRSRLDSALGAAPAAAAAGEGDAPTHKHFVLDTNVLLHNPGSVFMFEEHTVVIPLAVIEELDQFKKNNDETGRNAREVIRQLDRLRAKGHLFEGVRWNEEGGTVRIDRLDTSLPHGLDLTHPDNRILGVAFGLHSQGVRTIFVSKDINARVKCDALGIRAEDFEADRVDTDWLYTGFARLVIPGDLIDELYGERQLPMARLEAHLEIDGPDGTPVRFQPRCNQYLVLENEADDSHTGLARVLSDTGHVIPVTGPRKPVYGIMARNVQQIMALDLLLDDEVRLVSLIGPAGTGKTLMAIAAGMQKVMREEHYDKLLVARPIMPLGRDIGYLPGDKDEKLSMWMQPIFDNLAYLMSTRGSGANEAESRSTEQRIDALVMSGKVVMEPLTYIRGRSIPHQFMVVDEAQNLSPHEVKTIVSRVGDGTKIVLCGDIGQIDNPYLDASSNGLTHLIERMKGHRLAGHVTLSKTERSDLASLAAEIL